LSFELSGSGHNGRMFNRRDDDARGLLLPGKAGQRQMHGLGGTRGEDHIIRRCREGPCDLQTGTFQALGSSDTLVMEAGWVSPG
jgi:hypothetical protein